MKSPLRWLGGKAPLAKWIVSLMPKHLHYCEPYFGGGSVLFAKDPEGISEVVNDLNGDLMNFWRVLQCEWPFETFQRRIQAVPVSEPAWQESQENPCGCGRVDAGWETVCAHCAVRFFVRVRQSLAGRGAAFTALSRKRTRRGMNEQAAAWLTAVEGLPEVHARLKRIVILNRPALEVIRSQDGPDTLFYLDPPYLPETRRNGGGEYGPFEMTQNDHLDLIEVITQCKGKVMISGYDSVLYGALLGDWMFHTKVVANHASHAKVKEKECECVWTNF